MLKDTLDALTYFMICGILGYGITKIILIILKTYGVSYV